MDAVCRMVMAIRVVARSAIRNSKFEPPVKFQEIYAY